MQYAIKNENEHQQESIIQLKNTKQTVRVNLEANCLALALLHSSCDDPYVDARLNNHQRSIISHGPKQHTVHAQIYIGPRRFWILSLERFKNRVTRSA